MNFSQLQERVRAELLRRIERGTLSVSLLSRQTGVGQPHLSNFLHGRRQLSLGTLDKLLRSQQLSVADLLPSARGGRGVLMGEQIGEVGQVPLVSHPVALFEPYVRATSVQRMLEFPAETLRSFRPRCTTTRRQWERFVAVRLSGSDVAGMEPVLQADALVVLDRHYNSFAPYWKGESGMANLYGVRLGPRLVIRYADFLANRVVLRTFKAELAPEVMEVSGEETPNDLLVGRVALVVNEM